MRKAVCLDKMADVVNVKKMKVAELKKELAEHGLPIKGIKSELQARLGEFLQQQGVTLHQAEDLECEDDLEHDDDDDDDLGDDSVDDLVAEESPVEESSQEEKALDKPLVEPEIDQEKELLKENTENGEEKSTSQVAPQDTPHKHCIVLTPPSTETERKLQRIKKFGGPVAEKDKKLARAERFGSPNESGTKSKISSIPTSPTDVTVLKKRAERFGVISPVVAKVEEKDRMLKRKERFGASTVMSPSDPLEIKKKKRADRFAV